MKLFLVKLVLFVIYRTAPLFVIGEKMKIDHDYMNAHIGQGARKKNETVDQEMNRGGAGYLASLFGFTIMCEYATPVTYGARITQVM